MCGIAGIFGQWTLGEDQLHTMVRRMSATLAHRGPDDDGVWVDAAAGIALGHRRLAVIDLSQDGHQPMVSPDGRYVLCYNGEIYNFCELRAELENKGCPFTGRSDTEVLLFAITLWGVHGACARLTGMFAFAVWDRRTRQLFLARDRLGKKPLYYGRASGEFLFGSELKALVALPWFDRSIDRKALALYLRYNYVPAPYSIYHCARKLSPGAVLTVHSDGHTSENFFWSAHDVVESSLSRALHDESEALDGLEGLLLDAVGKRMVCDVSLGALLSGGVDSSLIVALMQHHSRRAVKTYTVGYEHQEYDESRRARAVARHLGTDHTELRVTPAEALAVIPDLPAVYDEPFGDSSQIPTYLISRIARQGVTVALSGDGGDELFGGYNRHVWANRVWANTHWMPGWARGPLAWAAKTPPPSSWDALSRAARCLTPRGLWMRHAGEKIQKFGDALGAHSSVELYRTWSSVWQRPADLLARGAEPEAVRHALPSIPNGDLASMMMYQDLITYLPDDILVKVDRASMRWSLEVRAPLLDHRLVEYAWRLPLGMKLRGGEGKWALRQVLHRYVPRKLVEGPKGGFAVPVGDWLRGPLREWAEALLNTQRLEAEGYLNPAPIIAAWNQHLAGRRNNQEPLWGVLMFQAWRERI